MWPWMARFVCLDLEGQPQFWELLLRCGRHSPTVFYAFDLLAPDGQDLRARSLTERKTLLSGLIPEQPLALLYGS
jgi:bifunctional non-homologous end joining protein LigD